MTRETSAGGVVLRQISGRWCVALIEPQKEESEKTDGHRKKGRAVLSLPKGLLNPGEKAQAAAVREVHEETGLIAESITKLADIKYTYTRSWGDGGRVFKVVSFYLMRWVSGEIGNIAPEMKIEVKRALWVALDEARVQMAYSSEKKVMDQAKEFVESGRLPEK